MKRVTLTAFMVFGVWLSFGQTARFGDLNRNSVVVTSAPPQSVVSVNGQTGAVSITAASLGALTAEQDLAALRTYHYGSPDIVESPAGWFDFDGAGTITKFNWEAGRTNVVIPWAIGGVPVTAIGSWAFVDTGLESGYPITSLIAPQTVTVIGDCAFSYCYSLTSVSLPQATTIGDGAFYDCASLTSINLPQATAIGHNAFNYCISLASVSLLQATSIGDYAFFHCLTLKSVHMGQNAPAEAEYVFADINPPPTVYVTDPQATGWGDTWNGAPVVRPPLYADEIWQDGERVPSVAAIQGIVYSNSVSALTIYTNASGVATSYWQVASGVTNSGPFAQECGVTFTNRTAMSDGVLSTTNGVFFTRLGTNYWILLD